MRIKSLLLGASALLGLNAMFGAAGAAWLGAVISDPPVGYLNVGGGPTKNRGGGGGNAHRKWRQRRSSGLMRSAPGGARRKQ